jgi:hypothetical protein
MPDKLTRLMAKDPVWYQMQPPKDSTEPTQWVTWPANHQLQDRGWTIIDMQTDEGRMRKEQDTDHA